MDALHPLALGLPGRRVCYGGPISSLSQLTEENVDISLDAVKVIYRRAIDEKVGDGEGADWWAAVAEEIIAVIRAKSITAAAEVIDWWHNDWGQVGDTAKAAAQRIRSAARALKVQ
ncbi:hypothetical protein Q3O97_05950 [Ralstonia pseudosolanacearum]|uniref:hypothetical protein n=1 Tax=Ralstonia pseudosolanacearum TaxID=1310165 RepID=UPI00270CE6B3|nr:hypothetical protein [Ralstonia pseudosolanacearum]MDO3615382.1 hypothetical protein [Ralstonia pseudosolanacearum]